MQVLQKLLEQRASVLTQLDDIQSGRVGLVQDRRWLTLDHKTALRVLNRAIKVFEDDSKPERFKESNGMLASVKASELTECYWSCQFYE